MKRIDVDNAKKARQDRAFRSPEGLFQQRLFVLEVGVLAVVTLLPGVHDVVRTRDVALFVITEIADNGLERTLALDVFGNSLRIVAAGGLGSFSNDLQRSVGVQRCLLYTSPSPRD